MGADRNAETMEITGFHLGHQQKNALRERARANGTNVAEEIRNAVDAYLADVTPEYLALFDVATRQTQTAIEEMNQMLDATNRNADRVFAEIERLRSGQSTQLSINDSALQSGESNETA